MPLKRALATAAVLLIHLFARGQAITPSGPITFCEGGKVTLTASGGQAYKWLLNGNPANGTQPTFDATAAGDYSVTIRVNGKDTTIGPVKVVVNSNPKADFNTGAISCAALPVNFTNTSTGDNLKYNWGFGDAASGSNTSSGKDVTHTFVGNAGNGTQQFAVKLVVTNGAGCKDSVTKNVSLSQAPDANLGGDGKKTYQNQEYFTKCGNIASDFSFNNFTTTDNVTYKITWGDGTPDYNDPNFVSVDHRYNLGTYKISYTVKGKNSCVKTADYSVFVGSNPGGSISSPSSTEGCTGNVFNFPFANIEKNPFGTQYIVSVDDGSSDTIINHPPPADFSHKFDKPSCPNVSNGSFTVKYIIQNPCSFTPGSIGGIKISQKPEAKFSISPKDTACVSTAITLKNESPTLYNVDGSGNCLQGAYIWKVIPATGFSISSGSLGNDFGKSDPSGWLTGSKDLGLTFTTPGTYSVTLKVGGNPLCGSDQITKTICITSVPTASFSLNGTTGCAPFAVTTTTKTNLPNCGEYSYKWTTNYTSLNGCSPSTSDVAYGNGTSASSKEPAFKFNNPGAYDITVLVTAPANSCSVAVDRQTVIVKGKPVITSFNVPVSICQNGSISPNVSSTCYNNETTYKWTFDQGQPATGASATPSQVTYGATGTFVVAVSATNSCGTTDDAKNLNVNPSPSLTIPADTTVCPGTTLNLSLAAPGANITWTNSNPSIGLPASGTGSSLQVTAANTGAATISGTVTVVAKIGNCSVTKTLKITVNPKPGAPTAALAQDFCESSPSQSLVAKGSGTLLWYTSATGGTGDVNAPAPATTTVGASSFYVSSKDQSTGCESDRTKIVVTIKPTPRISDASFANPATCGAKSGAITLKGLVAGKSYTINYMKNDGPVVSVSGIADQSGNVQLTNLDAGKYNAINVDLNGCVSNSMGPYTLQDPTTPDAPTVSSNGPICSGQQLQLSAATTLSGSILYTWSGPNSFTSTLANPTVDQATVFASGKYLVTIKQNNCTSAAGTVDVVVNATPVINTIKNDGPVCDQGTVHLTPTATPATVTYAWSGPNGFTSIDQNPDISPAPVAATGSYSLTVTNTVGGCKSGAATTSVVVNPIPVISKAVPSDPKNCAATTGTITLQGLDINKTYTVAYSNGVLFAKDITTGPDGSLVIRDLAAGSYSNITVKLNGCTSAPVSSVQLTDPNPPAAPTAGNDTTICSGNSFNLSASSPLPGPLTYNWSGPDNYSNTGASLTVPNAQVAKSGKYLVTVTQNSCTSPPAAVNITVNQTPATPLVGSSSPVCSGNDLKLTTTADPAFTFAWSGPDSYTSTDVSPVLPNTTVSKSGTYTLKITSKANCTSAAAATVVDVRPTPKISNSVATNPTNCATATGSITLEGLEANKTYTVSYSNGTPITKDIKSGAGGSLIIPGLFAGSYKDITVQLNGCTSNAVGPLQLTDPNPPAAPIAGNDTTICSGNAFNLSASSPLPGPLTYNWSGPDNYSNTGASLTVPNAQVAKSGKYLVTVTQNSCTSPPAAVNITVNQTPATPTVGSNSPVCTGSDLKLTTTADPAFTFAWSGPDSYTSTDVSPVLPNTTVSKSGPYILKVTSPASCTSPAASLLVDVRPTPNISNTSIVNPVRCGSATGSIALNGLTANTSYTVAYLDKSGAQISKTLRSDAAGAVSIPSLVAGTYTNIFATLNGCPSNAIAALTLTDPDPPATPKASGASPLCTGNDISLSATSAVPGAITFAWNGPAGFISTSNDTGIRNADVIHSGWYYVRITLNNCVSLPDSVRILVNPVPASPVLSSNTPVCREDSLKLHATSTTGGAVSFTWTGPNGFSSSETNPVISNVPEAAAGVYTAIAMLENCASTGSGSTTVAIKPKPTATGVSFNNPTSCGTYTGSIVLEGFAANTVYGLSYTWDNQPPASVPTTTNPAGAVVIPNLPAGTYTNITVNENGCPSNPAGPLTLVNVPATTPSIGNNGPLCQGDKLQLTSALAVDGVVTYAWLGPNGFTSALANPVIPKVSLADSGTYTVTTTLNGCSSTNNIRLVISPTSKGGVTGIDSTVCLGTNVGLVTVSDFTGTILRWQSSTDRTNWSTVNATQATLPYTNLTDTTYYRAVVASGICPIDYSTATTITVVSKVDEANAGTDQKLCNQLSVSLKANNPKIGKGQWSQAAGPAATIADPANSNTAVTNLQPGQTYRFVWTITGATGCGSTNDEVEIINRLAITTATAGSDVNICNFTNTRNITLAASSYRSFEKGLWSIIAQPAPSNATLSNPASPTSGFTFNNPGVYKLVWTIANDVAQGCAPSRDTMVIMALNPPVADFQLSRTQLCSGDAVTVKNLSLNANNYEWLWNDGDTASFVSGSHIYTAAGTFNIRLIAKSIVGAEVCLDSTVHQVVSVKKIPANLQVAGSNTCIPYNFVATALNTTGASAVDWIVYDHSVTPSVLKTSGTSVSHTYNFPAIDSVQLIVSNTPGCSDTATYHFKVYTVPVSTFGPAQLTTCGHDTTIRYTAVTSNTGGDPVNYRWFVNGQLTGNTNPFDFHMLTPVNAPASVAYQVQLLAQNNGLCGDTALSATATVLPLPRVAISVSPSLILQQPDYTFTFNDSSDNNLNKRFLWQMGDRSQQTRSERLIVYKYGDTGTYQVRLRVTDVTTGCSNNDSVRVFIQYIPGYLQVPNAICPGCSNASLQSFLPLGKGLKEYRLRIYTTWGQKLFETTALNADGSPKEAWNVRYDGNTIQQDTYRWEIEARYVNGTEWKGMLYPNSSGPIKSGFITVIK